jgi:guanylate kinase
MPSNVKGDPFDWESRPALLVISGPSGVGKDSVVQRLRERGCPFHFVITATDRPPRPGEVHGQDYYFYSTEEFEVLIAEDELIEHAIVYGQHKGVPRAHIREALASGKDTVMRVDVQGAATIKQRVPGAVLVFLTCESEDELIERLRERRSETEAELQQRIEMALEELSHIPLFDYVVVNRACALDEAVDDVLAILRAEHCRARPRLVVV